MRIINEGTNPDVVYKSNSMTTSIHNPGIPKIEESSPEEIKDELASKDLYDFKSLFPPSTLKALRERNITSIGELFYIEENDLWLQYFNKSFPIQNIISILNLIRCEYLDEDPNIDETDTKEHISNLYKSLGFSVKVYNALQRSYMFENSKDFFRAIRSEQATYTLLTCRTLGNVGVQEILEKAGIVIRYHDRHKEQIKGIKTDNKIEIDVSTLQTLKSELLGLVYLSETLSKKIAALEEKINQLTNEKGDKTI